MKKLKIIVAAIIRGALILSPGAAYLWWLWGKVAASVAILAAVGLETLWLIAFSFIVLFVQAWRDRKKEAESIEEPQEETADTTRS